MTLHGMVSTAAERDRAEHVAMGVDGVKAVKNLLQVVPSSQREMIERNDTDVKASVESAFKASHRLAESGIHVASVNKGVVLLSGKTRSLEAQAESVAVAYAVKGVRRLSTEVVVETASH